MRMRIKFQRKFSLEKLLMIVTMICVSSFALLEHMSISIPLFSALKMPLLYLAGGCLISQLNLIFKTFLKKKYFYVWLTVLGFCAALLLSAVANRNPDVGTSPMRSTIRAVLYIIELFMLTIWVSEKGMGTYFLRFLFKYLLILVLLTDVLLLTRIVVFKNSSHESYLIGTKFTVSYMHMNLLTLWMTIRGYDQSRKRISKTVLVLMSVFFAAISLRVECMTGFLGCVILLIFLSIVDARRQVGVKRLASPAFLTAGLGLNLIFPFAAQAIISIPFVEYFVVTILERSTTLTGRTNIFNIFSQQMNGHWMMGYGFGNGNAAALELFGYANAQNALLQWILQAGLITTVMLCGVVLLIFRNLSRSPKSSRAFPLMMLIYVYVLLGMIETTFSMSFILWVAVIFMQITESEPQEAPVSETEQ